MEVPKTPESNFNKLRFGPCNRGKPERLIEDTKRLIFEGFRTQQFYLGSSTAWNIPSLCPPDTKRNLKILLNSQNANFYIHAPHTVNMARPGAEDRNRSTGLVHKILNEIKDMPAGVVVHIGKVGTLSDTIDKLDKLENYRNIDNNILLENAAGQGTEIGTTIDDIYKLLEGVNNTKGLRICWDTQHSFGAGVCDWKENCAIELLNSMEDTMPGRLKLIHLNDSLVPFGKRVDRHASLTKGEIWKDDQTGLQELLIEAREREIDVICETNDFENDNNIIRNLLAYR